MNEPQHQSLQQQPANPPQPIRVLLVEDNPADARLLVESLKDAGYGAFTLTHVSRLSAAVESLARATPDVVLLDLSLPDSSGLETVDRIRAAAPAIAVVVLTGLQDESLALEALRRGVQDYLVKGQCEGGLAARALRYAVQRRQAELALRDREARLSAIVDSAVDSIITIDSHGIIESVNPATEGLFGYARDELIGRNVSMLMPEPYAGEHDGYIEKYLRTGVARIIGIGREVMCLRRDGTTFPVTLSVSEFEIAGRRMFTGIHHDISNRRRLEREILEASAAEQRRIGHDLHDGLCQQILGASFGIEVLAKRLEKSAPKEVPAVRKLEELLNDTLKQARALAHGLNPIDVRAGGLAKALHELCVRVADAFHVKCEFEGDDDGIEPADHIAIHLYRIAQESISNAIKHGGAKRIGIRLSSINRGGLTLTITDDGRGLPAVPNPRAGRGLQIMQYRAGIIGATLAVRAGDKRGTVVTCALRFPLFPGAGREQAGQFLPSTTSRRGKHRRARRRSSPDPA